MHAVDLIRRLHEHRAWVNGKLVDAAEKLSVEALREPFPIGQGSIWKSLLHMYAAEHVWLETLLGNENPLVPGDLPKRLPGNQEGTGAISSLAELKAKWMQLDVRWQTYLQVLTSDDLDQTVSKVSSSSGKRHATRRSDVLLHVCTHAHYTTAQVINMLRRSGAAVLPDVMLITLARH
ncbi:MAG: DinB family protein [Planctomycetia bacterium]|nr:DinB family protein [Planctomycetia bacterium]